MKNGLALLLVLAVSLLSTGVFAAEQHAVEGVVKAVKIADKKLTIQHGPIQTLGMSGMTMDFAVYDPAMLDEVAEGHKVSFMMEVDKDGHFIIVEIEDKGE